LICYAAKANSSLAILNLFARLGLRRARRATLDPLFPVWPRWEQSGLQS